MTAVKAAGKSGSKVVPVVGTVLTAAEVAYEGYKLYKKIKGGK